MVRETWRAVRAPWFAARGPGRVGFAFWGLVMYEFWVELESGERLVWRDLSRQMAVRMFNATTHREGAVRWGWAESKKQLTPELYAGV